jgi:hypothetical protein
MGGAAVPERLSWSCGAGAGAGGRPAGRPLSRRLPGRVLAGAPRKVDRSVNAVGIVGVGGNKLGVGVPLAGQRVTIRLEASLQGGCTLVR